MKIAIRIRLPLRLSRGTHVIPVVSALICGLVAASCVPASRVSGPLQGYRILLDPGHNRDNAAHLSDINRPVDAGGFTKPCNSAGTETAGKVSESSINFDIAQRTKVKLEALGATVLMTRIAESGWGPCVDSRGLYAGAFDVDVLVSIHADGSAAANHGFHVIRPGSIPGYTDRTAPESGRLATSLRDALVRSGLKKSTYAGSQGIDTRTDLGTLNRSVKPAVMLELGNLKNADDARVLTSSRGKDNSAAAITSGIRAFLGG